MNITLRNLTDLNKFASKIARSLKGGEILLLQGELGSGKTTFTKALAKALGIKKTVVSPTFTLCHTYQISQPSSPRKRGSTPKNWIPDQVRDDVTRVLLHIDAYRLKTPTEFLHLGALEHLGQPDTITVIEWPEKIKKFLPRQGRMVLQFAHGEKINERIVISN